MKIYNLIWKSVVYGESAILANSEKEARQLAEEGKDYNFDEYHNSHTDWILDVIEEKQGCEYTFEDDRRMKGVE